MLVRRRSRWLCLVSAAALAAGLAGCERSSPTERTAEAFDRQFAWLDADATTLDLNRWRRETARLKTLVPPGDVRRSLQYKTLACPADFDDVRAGFAFASTALAEAIAAGERAAQIRLTYCLAGYRELVEPSKAALAGYEEGLELARETNDPRLIAEGLSLRGSVRSLLGDQGLALLDFLEAQALYERGNYRRAAEANLQAIAIAYRRMGEYDKALEYLNASRAKSAQRKEWDVLVLDLLQLGFVYESLGQPERALRIYQEAEQLSRRHGWRYNIASAHLGMAGALVLLRRYDEALRMAEQARGEFAALGDGSNTGMVELYVGQALAGLGRHEAAMAHFDHAERDFTATGNERYLAMLYPERSASLEATGRVQAAVDDYKHFLALREALEKKHSDQHTQVLRYRFDAAQRDLDNRRLAEEKALDERQVAALHAARRWQWLAIGIGAALILVLGTLVARQVRRSIRLRGLALTDELTGVPNRRSIELSGASAVATARAAATPLTVLTVDIDRFKAINDTHGHFAGDEVLMRTAQACQAALRQFDRLGRIGGEEFLVLLPDTALDRALPIAERLRQAVCALEFEDLAPDLRVTLSIGAAELQPDDAGLADLMRRADRALYRAKRQGRNRVEFDASVPAAAPTAADPAQAAL
ncbi:diguanylate cyclase [Lysobacter korlensis]|uniref:diguanylate cyclase n=1 Tax=Lysobacter korlensis TaxID=553636 RepID=A0ABV6RHL3_9GAMM